jgi:DNA-binding SARP family transcriptional activator
MPALDISLFGPFQVRLNGELVNWFSSVKVQALLAYLAVEAGQAHRRETLAGLFWSDLPEAAARQIYASRYSNWERASPDYLLTTRQDILFKLQSDGRLDVTEFTTLIAACRSILTLIFLHASRAWIVYNRQQVCTG